jgi:hypothetical protein
LVSPLHDRFGPGWISDFDILFRLERRLPRCLRPFGGLSCRVTALGRLGLIARLDLVVWRLRERLEAQSESFAPQRSRRRSRSSLGLRGQRERGLCRLGSQGRLGNQLLAHRWFFTRRRGEDCGRRLMRRGLGGDPLELGARCFRSSWQIFDRALTVRRSRSRLVFFRRCFLFCLR